MAPSSNPIFRFRRVFQEVFTGSASGIIAYSPTVTLGKLPSFVEFQNLFTEYRFTSITCLFRPLQSTFSLVGPTTFPVVNSVFDYTDTAALTGLTAAMQYPSWKQNTFSQSRPHIQIVWKPRIINEGVSTTSGLGYALAPVGQFLSTSGANVEHFGLKTICEEMLTAVQIQVTFLCDLECRNVK